MRFSLLRRVHSKKGEEKGLESKRRANAVLYRLPVEIWLQIFGLMERDTRTLWYLARTCHLFRQLSLPLVYRTVWYGYEVKLRTRRQIMLEALGMAWSAAISPSAGERNSRWSHAQRIWGRLRGCQDCYPHTFLPPLYLWTLGPSLAASSFSVDDIAVWSVCQWVKEAHIFPRHITPSTPIPWAFTLHRSHSSMLSRMDHLESLYFESLDLDSHMIALITSLPKLKLLSLTSPKVNISSATITRKPSCDLKALELCSPQDPDDTMIQIILSRLYCKNLQELRIADTFLPRNLFSQLVELLSPHTLRRLELSGTTVGKGLYMVDGQIVRVVEEYTHGWLQFTQVQRRVTHLDLRRLPYTLREEDLIDVFPVLKEWAGGRKYAGFLRGRWVQEVSLLHFRSSTRDVFHREVIQPLRACFGPIRKLVLEAYHSEKWPSKLVELSDAVPYLESLEIQSHPVTSAEKCTQAYDNLLACVSELKYLTQLSIPCLEPDEEPDDLTLSTLGRDEELLSPNDRPISRRAAGLAGACPTLRRLIWGSLEFLYVGDSRWRVYLYGDDVEIPELGWTAAPS